MTPNRGRFSEAWPTDTHGDGFRGLSPDMSISLGARAKKVGEALVGEAVELFASHQGGTERPPFQQLIRDAMRDDQSLFAREDPVEVARRVVGSILDVRASLHDYEPGTWGRWRRPGSSRPGTAGTTR